MFSKLILYVSRIRFATVVNWEVVKNFTKSFRSDWSRNVLSGKTPNLPHMDLIQLSYRCQFRILFGHVVAQTREMGRKTICVYAGKLEQREEQSRAIQPFLKILFARVSWCLRYIY